eukprot:CCRYP_010475-RA/>CCRYP_010475-RA protein AED:0.04 eAED:0.04 QI:74/1/1/1/1/0.5/2/0/417
MQHRVRNAWDNGGGRPSSSFATPAGARRGYNLSSISILPSLPQVPPFNTTTMNSHAMMPPANRQVQLPPGREAMIRSSNTLMPHVPSGRSILMPFSRNEQNNRQFQAPSANASTRDSFRSNTDNNRNDIMSSNRCGLFGRVTTFDLHVIDRKREIRENESARFCDAHVKRVKRDTTRNDEVVEDVNVSASANQSPKDSEMHVIFAIDFSTSMNTADVNSRNGKISRWNAVFQCVDSFLDKQLQQQRQQGGGTDDQYHKCVVSVLIFNNESQVLLNRMQLDGDGTSVRAALKAAEKGHTPKGGTSFTAGFHEASILAAGSNDVNTDNVMVVFLSDGRPGDLRPRAPCDAKIPMQTTYRYFGREYRAAGWYIEKMQSKHMHFSLQLVCLYNEGKEWMEYLAKRYEGTLHNPDLTLDEDD